MWAQNFARSQVNYNQPMKDLAAAAPISLNPFADGVFGETTGTPDDYNQLQQPDQGGTVTEGHEGDAVTEAAIFSRLHQQNEESISGEKVPGSKSDGDLTVVLRGPNGFGTTVSKSFARSTDNGAAIVGVDTVNISIASYRVVESKKYGKYAQFLVIYREGSIRDTVGVWKRYRDFEELSNKVTQAHDGCAAVIASVSPLAMTEEPETEHLPNAITSWRLLKKRKRWYRCLDAGYLSLKVFLLERFLHDILFESSSPKLLRDFVLGPESRGPSM
uniref:PX domain-containing protein n=1 Tax=Entomoneis paludosa TaxID=265537 RepID=A0A7S2VGT4_9STRA